LLRSNDQPHGASNGLRPSITYNTLDGVKRSDIKLVKLQLTRFDSNHSCCIYSVIYARNFQMSN